MCVCKTPMSKCALSMTAAFPVMLLFAVMGHCVFGHGPVLPMPVIDLDLGMAGAWLVSIASGDIVRRGVRAVL